VAISQFIAVSSLLPMCAANLFLQININMIYMMMCPILKASSIIVIKMVSNCIWFQLDEFGMMEKKIEVKNLYKLINKFINFEFCI
jgi:hypothetical protein